MKNVYLLSDVTNIDGHLTKDHGPNLPRGLEVEIADEKADRLISIGAAKEVKKDDPEDKKLPDDLDALKAIADERGISYAQNISAKTLKDRITKESE
jgi:hypothetical protein